MFPQSPSQPHPDRPRSALAFPTPHLQPSHYVGVPSLAPSNSGGGGFLMPTPELPPTPIPTRVPRSSSTGHWSTVPEPPTSTIYSAPRSTANLLSPEDAVPRVIRQRRHSHSHQRSSGHTTVHHHSNSDIQVHTVYTSSSSHSKSHSRPNVTYVEERPHRSSRKHKTQVIHVDSQPVRVSSSSHKPTVIQVHPSANTSLQNSWFQYSKCTGRKKALCIGINYRGTPEALNGCINDAKRVRDFLMKMYNYKAEDIVLLSDDGRTARELPTKKNIIDAMRWLVQDAHSHDSLFFHYSGHGGQTRDLDGDEDDGYDEVIYPLDFKTQGHLTDDVMHDIMVSPLPRGCRLTAIFDCCHSGSALDLPFIYGSNGNLKHGTSLLSAANSISSRSNVNVNDITQAMENMLIRKRSRGTGRPSRTQIRRAKISPADVILWSGCKDSQTSADVVQAGEATGAMSYAFVNTLKQNPNQSYLEILRSVREVLRRRYSQKPQLSSSHPIDTSLKFVA